MYYRSYVVDAGENPVGTGSIQKVQHFQGTYRERMSGSILCSMSTVDHVHIFYTQQSDHLDNEKSFESMDILRM